MLRTALALLLVITTARSVEAQQIVAAGDSVRWSETDVGLTRKGTGRVLVMDPAGLRVLHRTDTVSVRFANLSQLQRYKKPPRSRLIMATASVALGAALAAYAPKTEYVCDGTRCFESTLQNSRLGNPVVFGAVGAAAGLGLGLFFEKVKPGPWITVAIR